MIRRIVPLAFLVLAQVLPAQRVQTTAAITAADLRERLFRIADDSMKGRRSGSIEDSVVTDYIAAEFKRVGLKPAGDNGTWFQVVPLPPRRASQAQSPLHQARNVVGIVEGRDPKLRGQYISITGHNDHVGVCSPPVDHDSARAFLRVYRPMGADTRTWTVNDSDNVKVRHLLDSLRRIHPARADSICNGADDDGSGTVAILELAEYFGSLPVSQRPARSILFVSHTAEEVGLVGSAWYTDHSTVPMDSIVAEIDEDMIGRGAKDDLPEGGPTYLEVVGLRRLSNEFGDLMEEVNAKQKVPFVFNYQFDVPGHPLQYYCRADHYSYARYGVPSVAFSRGEHLDYHQVTDEPQYIDYDDLLRVVLMVRDGIVRIGNLDHRPKLDQPKQSDPHARCVQ